MGWFHGVKGTYYFVLGTRCEEYIVLSTFDTLFYKAMPEYGIAGSCSSNGHY